MNKGTLLLVFGGLWSAFAQDPARAKAEPRPDNPYVIEAGVKIPLSLMNTVSSKQAAEGDRVYLETMYPVLVNGKIVVPSGELCRRHSNSCQAPRPRERQRRALSPIRLDDSTERSHSKLYGASRWHRRRRQ